MNIENELPEQLPEQPPKINEIVPREIEDDPPKLSELDQIPSLEQSQKKAAEICIPFIEEEYDGWFQKLTELQDGNIIIRANCKFCNHPVRSEAEEEWEKNHSIKSVNLIFEKYAQEHSGEEHAVTMNFTNIKNHLVNHYEQVARKIQVREYGDRLRDMINYKISKDKQFEALSTSLQMQYMYIASDPDIEKVKQSETLVKLSKALLEIIETQAKIRGELSAADVMSDKFVNVWVNMISQEKDPERQKMLLEKLEMFRAEMAPNG